MGRDRVEAAGETPAGEPVAEEKACRHGAGRPCRRGRHPVQLVEDREGRPLIETELGQGGQGTADERQQTNAGHGEDGKARQPRLGPASGREERCREDEQAQEERALHPEPRQDRELGLGGQGTRVAPGMSPHPAAEKDLAAQDPALLGRAQRLADRAQHPVEMLPGLHARAPGSCPGDGSEAHGTGEEAAAQRQGRHGLQQQHGHEDGTTGQRIGEQLQERDQHLLQSLAHILRDDGGGAHDIVAHRYRVGSRQLLGEDVADHRHHERVQHLVA